MIFNACDGLLVARNARQFHRTGVDNRLAGQQLRVLRIIGHGALLCLLPYAGKHCPRLRGGLELRALSQPSHLLHALSEGYALGVDDEVVVVEICVLACAWWA